MEKQEKDISVSCPRCKGTHTVKMLLERPTSVIGNEFVPTLSRSVNRQLEAILVCPKTHRKYHKSIVMNVEDYWDIKGMRNVD